RRRPRHLLRDGLAAPEPGPLRPRGGAPALRRSRLWTGWQALPHHRNPLQHASRPPEERQRDPADVVAPTGDRSAKREPGVESRHEQPAGGPLPARARGPDRRLPRSLQLPLPVPLRLRRQRGAVEERRIRPPPPARPLRARYPAALRAL